MPEVIIIPLLAAAAAAVAIWALTLRYRRRELEHKERLAAIEKGAPLPAITGLDVPAAGPSRAYLLRGLIWLFGGIGISIFLFGLAITTEHAKTVQQRAFEIWRLKQVGASEELIQQVQNDNTPYRELPLGLGLAGLAPAGVGLAYLIAHHVEKKNSQAG
jgi:hypothetical protein